MAKNYKDAVTTEVAVDGEKEYKKACNEIVKNLKELGSEMKRVSAEFADSSDSMEAMQSKYEILGKELKEQERLLEATTKALKELEDAGQGNSDQAQKLRTELNKTNTHYIQIQRSMEKMSAAMDKAGSEYEQFRRSAEGIDDTLEDLGDELKLLDKQMRLSEDSTEDVRKKHDLLNRVLDEQERKVSDLERAYEAAKRETGENSRETRELQRALNNAKGAAIDTQAEIKQLGRVMDQAADDANDAGNEFGGFADVLSNLGGPFADAADVLGGIQSKLNGLGVSLPALINPMTLTIAGLGAALGAVAVESAKFSAEVDNALTSFGNKTGIAAKNSKEFRAAMLDVYKSGVGDNMQDIADAMAAVAQATGQVDPKRLQGMTNAAITLRDTFGMDIPEGVRSAQQLIETFGTNATKAFDTIARAAQLGLDKDGNLLDTINEYSIHYKQLGLDMEDMFDSLLHAKEAGVFDLDKAGDAIKEFGIRVREGSEETKEAFKDLGLNADELVEKFNAGGEGAKQAMQQVVEALMSMDDQVLKNQSGVALFGTMWEDLGEKGIGAATDTNDALKGVNGTIDKINQADLSTIEGAWGHFTDTVKATGATGWEWLETWLPEAINGAADRIDQLNAKLKGEEVEEPDVSYYAALTGRTTFPNMNNGELWAQRFGPQGMKEGEVAGPPKPTETEKYYLEDLWASGALDEQEVSAQLEAIHKGIMEAGNQALEDAETIYGELGKKALESYGAGIAESGATVEQSVTAAMEEVTALAADLMEGKMPAVGELGMTALASGVNEGEPAVNSAVVDVVTTASENAESTAKVGGEQAGATLAISVASGVEVNAAGFYRATHQMAADGVEAVQSHAGEFNNAGAGLAASAASGFESAAGQLQAVVNSAVSGAVSSMSAGVAKLLEKVKEAQAVAAQMPSGSGSSGITVNQTINATTSGSKVAKAAANVLKDAIREVTW